MKKIPLPESQVQEVLFELITRMNIDRKTMMLSSGVMNLTAIISNLRQKGLKDNIVSNEIKAVNKYGRDIKFVQYSLKNKIEAREVYMKLKTNQAGIPINGK